MVWPGWFQGSASKRGRRGGGGGGGEGRSAAKRKAAAQESLEMTAGAGAGAGGPPTGDESLFDIVKSGVVALMVSTGRVRDWSHCRVSEIGVFIVFYIVLYIYIVSLYCVLYLYCVYLQTS